MALTVWVLVCLVFTMVAMARQSKTVEGKPNEVHPVAWPQVAISVVSFAVWAYALGGPFVAWGIYLPWLGTLLILGWTFLVPFIYPGTKA